MNEGNLWVFLLNVFWHQCWILLQIFEVIITEYKATVSMFALHTLHYIIKWWKLVEVPRQSHRYLVIYPSFQSRSYFHVSLGVVLTLLSFHLKIEVVILPMDYHVFILFVSAQNLVVHRDNKIIPCLASSLFFKNPHHLSASQCTNAVITVESQFLNHLGEWGSVQTIG